MSERDIEQIWKDALLLGGADTIWNPQYKRPEHKAEMFFEYLSYCWLAEDIEFPQYSLTRPGESDRIKQFFSPERLLRWRPGFPDMLLFENLPDRAVRLDALVEVKTPNSLHLEKLGDQLHGFENFILFLKQYNRPGRNRAVSNLLGRPVSRVEVNDYRYIYMVPYGRTASSIPKSLHAAINMDEIMVPLTIEEVRARVGRILKKDFKPDWDTDEQPVIFTPLQGGLNLEFEYELKTEELESLTELAFARHCTVADLMAVAFQIGAEVFRQHGDVMFDESQIPELLQAVFSRRKIFEVNTAPPASSEPERKIKVPETISFEEHYRSPEDYSISSIALPNQTLEGNMQALQMHIDAHYQLIKDSREVPPFIEKVHDRARELLNGLLLPEPGVVALADEYFAFWGYVNTGNGRFVLFNPAKETENDKPYPGKGLGGGYYRLGQDASWLAHKLPRGLSEADLVRIRRRLNVQHDSRLWNQDMRDPHTALKRAKRLGIQFVHLFEQDQGTDDEKKSFLKQNIVEMKIFELMTNRVRGAVRSQIIERMIESGVGAYPLRKESMMVLVRTAEGFGYKILQVSSEYLAHFQRFTGLGEPLLTEEEIAEKLRELSLRDLIKYYPKDQEMEGDF